MNKAMYPVDCCIDLAKEEQHWFEDLSRDSTYGHIILYVAHAYFDFVKSRRFGPAAMMHTNETISLLQKTLAQAHLIVTDSTLFTVLALAMVAEVSDDLETAKNHIRGLHQLILLRGGMPAISQKRTLQIKCCRFVHRTMTMTLANDYLKN